MAAEYVQPLTAPEITVMNKIKKSTGCAADPASIDARRKSFITVLASVLARDLELMPAVANKPKQKKGI